MLERKLEQASREAFRSRLIALGAIMGIVTIAGLILLNIDLMKRLDDATGGRSGEAPPSVTVEIPQPVDDDAEPVSRVKEKEKAAEDPHRLSVVAEPGAEDLQAANAISSQNQVENAAGKAPQELPTSAAANVPRLEQEQEPELTPSPATVDTRPLPEPAKEQVSVAPHRTSDPDQSIALRDEFKSALKAFEKDLGPPVADDSFAAWNSRAQLDVNTGKEQAVSEFARGNYTEALTTLEAARNEAIVALEARANAFADAMQKTRDALDHDDYEQAQSHITQAKRWMPRDPTVAELKAEVEALPAVLKHISSAAIKRSENDLEGELAQLKKALALDPGRSSLSSRAKVLGAQIRENRFTKAVRRGLAGVDGRDLEAAQAALRDAQAIDPQRQEVEVLSAKVTSLDLRLKTTRLLAFADDHAHRDEWHKAKGFYGEVLALNATNDAALQGHQRANDINGLHDSISRHLTASERLASANVAKLARELVDRAESLSPFSPSLQESAKKLKKALSLYVRKVDVWVISDGETSIAIRGVGRVGKTTGRAIQLKPGTYTFEGIRSGYQAKLVRISVPTGVHQVEVTVICDELI